jgi:hypothetical protein
MFVHEDMALQKPMCMVVCLKLQAARLKLGAQTKHRMQVQPQNWLDNLSQDVIVVEHGYKLRSRTRYLFGVV